MKDLKETILQDINEIATGKDPLIGKAKTTYHNTTQTVKPEDLKDLLGELPNENPISHEILGTNKEGNVEVRFSTPSGKAPQPSGKEAVSAGLSKRSSFLDRHFEQTAGRTDALIGLANEVKSGGNKPITLPAEIKPKTLNVGKFKSHALIDSGHTLEPSTLRNLVTKKLDTSLETLVTDYNRALPKEGNPESPYFQGVKKRLQTVTGRFGRVASGFKALATEPESFVTAKGGINAVTSDPAKSVRNKDTKAGEAENAFASLMTNLHDRAKAKKEPPSTLDKKVSKYLTDYEARAEASVEAEKRGLSRSTRLKSLEDIRARTREVTLAQRTGRADASEPVQPPTVTDSMKEKAAKKATIEAAKGQKNA